MDLGLSSSKGCKFGPQVGSMEKEEDFEEMGPSGRT